MHTLFKKTILTIVLLMVMAVSCADLIPGNSAIYYKFGGGDIVPEPPVMNTQTLPLGVSGSIGLGYNCGSFNPIASIVNSLNNMKGSFQDMMGQVIASAKGALMEMPAYLIEKADPSLYQMIQSGIFNGQKDFELSTKSCEMMAAQIDQGQNPYNNWLQASLGDNWKYHMSLANDDSPAAQTLLSENLGSSIQKQDVNQAKKEVSKDNGKRGVPWTHGPVLNGSPHAGGKGQPEILLIQDAVIAGYNVLLDRDYDNKKPPLKTKNNERIVSVFLSPAAAAQWTAKVAGDHLITTYSGGDKKSEPGVGLLGETQTLTNTIKKDLTSLVDGEKKITPDNLRKISSPRVMINQSVILTIRKQISPIMQMIIIQKLSQEVAAARIIDKANMARELLEIGSQVPSIYANKAAQKGIQSDVKRLKDDINNILFNQRVNKELVSSTVNTILNETARRENRDVRIRPSADTPEPLDHGAIIRNHHNE